MYESLLNIPERSDGGADAPLAAIAWPELAARLAARRDFRRELRAGETGAGNGASFNPAAADMLTGRGDGKRHVNRDALADGKQPWVNAAEAADIVAAGD